MFDRAKELLSPRKTFGQPAFRVGPVSPRIPRDSSQMILRMMVRAPYANNGNFQIPEELEWLAPTIYLTNKLQLDQGILSPFVYVTVRHGLVTSVTDDLWHVDGFSMRVPHVPEQNYIWSNNYGTEVLNQKIDLPADFDAMRHNIHLYFQDVANSLENLEVLSEGILYGIDPYVIHRRPTVPSGTKRTFFRISYVPIEIEDDTCTVNPLIPRVKPYAREDIRKTIGRYPVKC